jgi:biotin carboxyl carrier protein
MFGTAASTRTSYGSWTRRLVVAGAASGTIVLAGMIPKTMTVSIPASLRPENVRTHYAPTDAVVQQVLVRHGDAVVEGQTMIVLQDLALDEQTTTLIGRRAVVGEKLARVVGSLVELPSSGNRLGNRESAHASDDSLVQQQRLLEEEQRGIDQQLELLAQARQRLMIRADRAGTVDAWQTELVALGRPVRTGESLVWVESADSRWVVDAKVPQNRRQLVMQRLTRSEDPVRLRIGDSEGEATTAKFARQIGFETSPTGGPPATIVELAIDAVAGASDPSSTIPTARWRNGMPVEVTVDCGEMPLAKVLFFDLIRSVRLQWEKWR